MGLATVAAGHAATADAAAGLLSAGGNAVDAAVGGVFAAFAAEPVLTGPFGGGFAMVAGPRTAAALTDGFADVPGLGLAAPGPDLDFVRLEVDFGATTQVFHAGRGAVAVPSLLGALVALQRTHGRLSIAAVVEPAQSLAASGCPVAGGVAGFLPILQPILTLTKESRALFAPNGSPLRPGDHFASPDLAALLARVAQGAGAPGEAELLDLCAAPSGRVTARDLASCKPAVRPPIDVPFGNYRVLLNPPPASSGILIGVALRLLADVDPQVWQDEERTALHLIAAMHIMNCVRRDGLDAQIGEHTASIIYAMYLEDAAVDRYRGAFLEAARAGVEAAASRSPEMGSTTHVSVIDGEGLACAITSSNGEGCGYVVPGCGVLANNFLGEEDLNPHGFHRGTPGRRMTSMMSPTLVLRDGQPVLSLGTGGANRIRTALLQVLVHHLLRGLPLDVAVEMPRMHYEGHCLYIERRGPGTKVPSAVLDRLEQRFHETIVFEAPNLFFGGVHAAGTSAVGAGDPRRGGVVRVVAQP